MICTEKQLFNHLIHIWGLFFQNQIRIKFSNPSVDILRSSSSGAVLGPRLENARFIFVCSYNRSYLPNSQINILMESFYLSSAAALCLTVNKVQVPLCLSNKHLVAAALLHSTPVSSCTIRSVPAAPSAPFILLASTPFTLLFKYSVESFCVCASCRLRVRPPHQCVLLTYF